MIRGKQLTKWIKIAAFIVVFAALYLLGASFKVNNLKEKAIIVGLGIDYDFTKQEFAVVAEIIAASADDMPIGSRLLEGNGVNVSKALQEIYKKTGLTPSLGQCSIIVIGSEVAKKFNITDLLSYFTFSDAFKDGVTIAVSEKNAKEIFEKQTPNEVFVSFALHTIIEQSGETTNTPSNDLQHFVEKQLTPSKCSYLSIVKFLPDETISNENDPDSDKKGGLYIVEEVAIFKQGKWVAQLDKEQTRGFNFVINDKSFETFEVNEKEFGDKFGGNATIAILNKKVGFSCNLDGEIPVLEISMKIKLKEMRTDFSGYFTGMSPKTDSDINNEMKYEVQQEIIKLINNAVEASKIHSCDFLEINNKFYRKYGAKWTAVSETYSNIAKDINIVVKVQIL